MTARIGLSVLIATLLTGASASAQSPGGQAPLAHLLVDPANGLSLEQAITRAIEQEPSLRAARSQVEMAEGTKLQAAARPNPSISFERRQEPGGTDRLTAVGIEWRTAQAAASTIFWRSASCCRGTRNMATRWPRRSEAGDDMTPGRTAIWRRLSPPALAWRLHPEVSRGLKRSRRSLSRASICGGRSARSARWAGRVPIRLRS